MMAIPIDNRAFFLSMRTPQQKYNPFPMLVYRRNYIIRKGFPTESRMRMGFTGFYGEHRIYSSTPCFAQLSKKPCCGRSNSLNSLCSSL